MCYGEFDILKREQAEELVRDGTIRGAVHVIKGAPHHLFLDSPEMTLTPVLKGFFELEKEELTQSQHR